MLPFNASGNVMYLKLSFVIIVIIAILVLYRYISSLKTVTRATKSILDNEKNQIMTMIEMSHHSAIPEKNVNKSLTRNVCVIMIDDSVYCNNDKQESRNHLYYRKQDQMIKSMCVALNVSILRSKSHFYRYNVFIVNGQQATEQQHDHLRHYSYNELHSECDLYSNIQSKLIELGESSFLSNMFCVHVMPQNKNAEAILCECVSSVMASTVSHSLKTHEKLIIMPINSILATNFMDNDNENEVVVSHVENIKTMIQASEQMYCQRLENSISLINFNEISDCKNDSLKLPVPQYIYNRMINGMTILRRFEMVPLYARPRNVSNNSAIHSKLVAILSRWESMSNVIDSSFSNTCIMSYISLICKMIDMNRFEKIAVHSVKKSPSNAIKPKPNENYFYQDLQGNSDFTSLKAKSNSYNGIENLVMSLLVNPLDEMPSSLFPVLPNVGNNSNVLTFMRFEDYIQNEKNNTFNSAFIPFIVAKSSIFIGDYTKMSSLFFNYASAASNDASKRAFCAWHDFSNFVTMNGMRIKTPTKHMSIGIPLYAESLALNDKVGENILIKSCSSSFGKAIYDYIFQSPQEQGDLNLIKDFCTEARFKSSVFVDSSNSVPMKLNQFTRAGIDCRNYEKMDNELERNAFFESCESEIICRFGSWKRFFALVNGGYFTAALSTTFKKV